MKDPDHSVHEFQALRGAQCPALCEHEIVDVLEPDTTDFPKDIERMQHFLKVYKPHFPGPVLLLDQRLQRSSSRSMTTPGIEIDKIYFYNIRHKCFIPVSHRCHSMAVKG
jgi:hypothetical protein